MSAAEKTTFRSEFDHISFHRQNWLGGIIAAIAFVVSEQELSVGLTESKSLGTVQSAMGYEMVQRCRVLTFGAWRRVNFV